ncbi:beta-lactamase/transpeptidase-like protein [Thermothelomyces heterothallicus CBS 203.75]
MQLNIPDFESPLIKEQISRIKEAFGTPSISCGVLHHGQVIFRHSEGYANVQEGKKADSDTVYLIASCSKAFVSATCAILAHEGVLSWDTPVSNYLPEFATPADEIVGQRATLADLCSHGTGLAPIDHAVMGFWDEFYGDGADQVAVSARLPVVYDFRSRFLYNNSMMGVAGEVIRKVCGKSTGTVLKEKILAPLKLTRTCTSAAEYPADGNVAIGYSILDDGSVLPLRDPQCRDGSVQAGAGFVRSTVNDMLRWAKAVMDSEKAEARGETPMLPGISFTRCAHRPLVMEDGLGENSYGMGWFRHTLPSRWLSSIGPNSKLLDDDPPVIGKNSPPRLALAHYGEFGGFLAAFYTFPATDSAIVVLANSAQSRGDPTDLIAQALCQELFDMRPRVALDQYARESARRAGLRWSALVREWEANRVPGTRMRNPADYVGTYTNEGFKLAIRVYLLPDSAAAARSGGNNNPELLGFQVNGLPRQTAKLRHYHYDTWTFLPESRDDASRKGMELYLALPYVLLEFKRGHDDRVCALEWDLQGGDCEGPAPGLGSLVKPHPVQAVTRLESFWQEERNWMPL